MKGRKPKPTALLQLEKGKLYDIQRDRAALEPKPQRELKPRCPQRFTKDERKAWRDISAVLKNYNLFTAANAMQLELLTTAWAQYLTACKDMTGALKGKIFISDGAGGFKENPALRTQQRLRTEINTYLQNLGLSSVSMAKLGSLMLTSKKQKSELEELLD